MPVSLRFLLSLTLLLSVSATAQELAKYGSAFSGNQGVTVLVAPTADDKQALVQIKGVNHAIDGVVLLVNKELEGERVFYRTQIDGRPRAILGGEERYGTLRMFVMLPGVRDPIAIVSDETATKALKPNTLRAEYQAQKRAGLQDKLAKFDRPAAVARQQQEIADADRAASQMCGATVSTTVIWDSISDDQLQRLHVPSFCAAPANAMRSLCDNEAQLKPVLASYPQIECRFGERLRLRSETGKLLFTTEESAVNQGEFALQYLRNL